MAIKLSDLKFRCGVTRAEDDVTTEIGGAIDLTCKPDFTDVGAAIQIVSSAAADTTQAVTVSYRDAASNILTEAKTLNGRTPVSFTAVPERLTKAVKGATCAGVVAVEAVTAEHTGTATAGSADTLTLDAGASAVDGAYNGMVIRITAGTGQYTINQVIDYIGATKVATFAFPASVPLDATSVFRISKGMVFDLVPSEVLTVTRLFYNATFPAPGGTAIKLYDCLHIKNTHASLDGSVAQALELLDPSGLLAFALAATLDSASTNGAGNTRRVGPGLTFDSAAKAMANAGVLTHGKSQQIWVELTLAAGGVALNTTWVPEASMNTV